MLKISAFIVMEDLQESSSTSSSLISCSSSSSSPNQHPLAIDTELWLMAEERIQEILCIIQPALASEQKRKGVIEYLQQLINSYYGVEVFSFGSVPLKTYLPDGDIDLTVVSHQNAEEDLARDVCRIFESEELDSEFQVIDVQYVRAQVKIVKCSVKDIPVDISFNQMAGLSALCFLEQVDQLIGNDHLFKRSIILIKAWCYYESRILGAHYGLISTYALEMLVLCIINLFHSSLCGPLAVLYRFLDYYSTFDWDNYCVSINGPVAISSLPELVDTLGNDGDELLLSQEFLRRCREIYSVPIKALETTGHEFPVKHLNIVDPLKDNNNLGRSVSKGNFHRIRCALLHGAQRLGAILMLPGESIGMGLEKFFLNTLDRNGKGQRPDAQVPVSVFGTGRYEESDLNGDFNSCYNGLLYGQWYHDYTLPVPSQLNPSSPPSEIRNRSAWDSLRQFVRCKRNLFYRWGTEVFVPRLPFCHPYVSQLSGATFNVDEVEKSRGTGTYIPDMTHHSYKETYASARVRNSESNTHVLTLKSCTKTGQDEDLPERDKGRDGYSLDLSLDEFPHLPVIKKPTPSEANHQFDQSTVNSMQAMDCPSPTVCIKFGSYEQSVPLLRLPSSPVRKMKYSGASTTSESKQESSESDEDMVIIQSYHLKDEDFPPLSS
ncbi:uncharacterized protein LOC116129750 [Pistacia vera]|uniref:uncharacterized protein LOC116129750 n=1 Tax=Pistacia vera TaxID=55513 RepID=UPI0012631471|nr:uncharacterized protein LOC116129750 [Pistacia vera]XP_031271329.1 uncharacterized protein LOC116129750 [Pistacia vera]